MPSATSVGRMALGAHFKRVIIAKGLLDGGRYNGGSGEDIS